MPPHIHRRTSLPELHNQAYATLAHVGQDNLCHDEANFTDQDAAEQAWAWPVHFLYLSLREPDVFAVCQFVHSRIVYIVVWKWFLVRKPVFFSSLWLCLARCILPHICPAVCSQTSLQAGDFYITHYETAVVCSFLKQILPCRMLACDFSTLNKSLACSQFHPSNHSRSLPRAEYLQSGYRNVMN